MATRRRKHESWEMAIDPYQPCPCGIEKKIKFCCGAEILGDLEKVEGDLSGDQRIAALDHIERALESKANRPCMLMYKAIVQMGMGEEAPARKTTAALLSCSPENPAGLALSAMLHCSEGKVTEAIAELQQAMELQKGKLLPTVYEALGTIGAALLQEGLPLAARHYFLFQVMASQSKDQNALQALLRLDGSGMVPLAALGFVELEPLPAESELSAALVGEFNQALQDWRMGCFHAAAKRFEKLAPAAPNEPLVWRNLGVLLSSLAENTLAAASLRRYATFPSIPREEAIAAEAMALQLTVPADEDLLSESSLSVGITDVAALRERWTSNKLLISSPFDPQDFVDAGLTPPLAEFALLDRPPGDTADGLTQADIAVVQGQIEIYGKQTDREARAVFTTLKDAAYPAKLAAFHAALGEFRGPDLGEELSPTIDTVGAALRGNWVMPKETTPEASQRLIQERFEHVLLNNLPAVAIPALDGQNLRQAAANPALQNRAAAIILNLESGHPNPDAIFDELRRNLGLPIPETLDPTVVKIAELPAVRLLRVELAKLSDQEALDLYYRSQLTANRQLILRSTLEVTSRPSLDNQFNKAEAFMMLARISQGQSALDYLLQAQAAAVMSKTSPAKYLMAEIPLRLQRGEIAEFQRVIQTLQARHMKEPGVAETLYSLMHQLGLTRPRGGGAPAPLASPLAAEAAAPASPGVWSPESPAPSASKSKLWLPGMD